jgi:hypothetical protein
VDDLSFYSSHSKKNQQISLIRPLVEELFGHQMWTIHRPILFCAEILFRRTEAAKRQSYDPLAIKDLIPCVKNQFSKKKLKLYGEDMNDLNIAISYRGKNKLHNITETLKF